MRKRARASVVALVAVASAAVSTSASATVTKDQCVDADTQAQSLRRDGKFGAAGEQLRVCADALCPSIVREDCIRRLDELERVQPTVVFEAKGPAGEDLTAVHVLVDGRRLADSLNGAALSVDPGEHTFTFEVAGQPPATLRLVLHEAEKSRRERVVVGSVPAGAPTPEAPAAPSVTPAPDVAEPSSAPARMNTQKIVGLAVGGAGIVGIGIGSAFGLVAMSKENDAKCDPAGMCNNAQAAREAFGPANASTVAFIAGGVALTAGVVLFLLAPKSTHPTAGRLDWTPVADAHGGGMNLRGLW